MRWHSEGLQCFSIESSELREEMADEEEDPWTRGVRLASDLDAILESDPYMYAMAMPFPLFLSSSSSMFSVFSSAWGLFWSLV